MRQSAVEAQRHEAPVVRRRVLAAAGDVAVVAVVEEPTGGGAQVIQRDPDYIVTITMYYGEGPTPVEEIMSREGWQNLKAVQNNAIYNADYNEISRPGPRLTDAAEALYQFVYAPEALAPAA